ncbi:membrane protein [Medicago truncatula]|uniref:Membrane protein n=1 Tax=Medicago truncatula TaxID=3880 RepID=A0A072U6L8_MEDTR|nr:membrane protein [Medicago truncatula]
MIPLKTYQHRSPFIFSSISKPNPLHPHFLSLPPSPPLKLPLKLKPCSFPLQRVSNIEVAIFNNEEVKDLSPEGEVYQKTLQLVECSMFAALTGLVYFLSNALAIENYFSCFFSLPIVISSMRWGIDAGRKTMVATTILLFVLSGPVKALTYLLKHGIVGYTMGTLWRLETSWSLSVFLCAIVRSIGAVGFVLISSFLIRENILALVMNSTILSPNFSFIVVHVWIVSDINKITV